MRRENISLHIGGFGINAGKTYWETLAYQENVKSNGECEDSASKFFMESSLPNHRLARALFVDTACETLDCLKENAIEEKEEEMGPAKPAMMDTECRHNSWASVRLANTHNMRI